MKKGPHQWPTDAATRKYVDRATDRLGTRLDRQTEKIRGLQADLARLRQHVKTLLEASINDDQQG